MRVAPLLVSVIFLYQERIKAAGVDKHLTIILFNTQWKVPIDDLITERKLTNVRWDSDKLVVEGHIGTYRIDVEYTEIRMLPNQDLPLAVFEHLVAATLKSPAKKKQPISVASMDRFSILLFAIATLANDGNVCDVELTKLIYGEA